MADTITGKRNIKVYILYLMENIGYPLDFVTLGEMIRQNDFVIYLDFATSFHELLEGGLVEKTGTNEKGEPTYAVTRQGRLVADSLHGDIMAPILDKSLEDALRYLDFQQRGVVAHTNAEQLSDGRVQVWVYLTEGEKEIFRTSVLVDTVNRAERMMKNFEEHPGLVYRGTLSLLSGNVNYLLSESNK